MKIAILTPTFCGFSGVDRAVEQQADELAYIEHEVTIFTFDSDLKPKNAKVEIIGMTQNLFLQRIYRLIFPLDFIKVIKWVPKLKNFDLIISQIYPMTWLAYLAKKFYGIRYVYHDHGIAHPELYSSFVERTYARLFKWVNNWTIKKADSVISISKYTQKELKKETDLDSNVIYNKINIKFHKKIDGSEIRKRYNLNNDPVILYVGRIAPHKGVHLLVEVVNLVKQEIPNAKLIIVGKHTFNNYSKKLKQICDDSVIFADYVSDDDLPYYYAACDVYASCTLWEGFNLPLAEAQACGKPVVAFDIGPHKEVVDEGKTGLLVRPKDSKAFADAIIKLLQDEDLAKKMGENGRRLVKEKYTWKGLLR